MTQFGLNPGFVKLRYDDAHRPHFATYQVDPSGVITAGVEPDFAVKGGGAVDMTTCVTDWANVFKANFAAATSIVSAEFWSKPNPDDDPVWIFAVDLGIAGTGGGTDTFTRQLNRTFRTGAGHIMRNLAMGISSAIPNDFVGPIPGADAVAVYLLGATNWIQGRDNSFPVASLNYISKTNDALRKLELNI